MKFPHSLVKELEGFVLCWLATVSEANTPNVSPKEIFCFSGDDTILIADIASPITVANISSNPQVCVSIIDVFKQRGFKISGHAKVIAQDDPQFADMVKPLRQKAGPDFPIRNVILIESEKVSRIWAPSYKIFPDRSEHERMADAYKTYGVRKTS